MRSTRTSFDAVTTAATVLLAAAALSCGGSEPLSSGGNNNGKPPAQAPLGADISALAKLEQAGNVYRDSGKAKDAIAILRSHGVQWFRLRLFVAPNGQDVQVNDLPYTVALASRIKAAGGKLLLDIHYSDTWADPSHQTPPSGWSTTSLDTLAGQVRSYTAAAIAALQRAGATPDVVQLGNEIDAGILWPLGQVTGSDTAQFNRLARLLEAGISGVHDSLVSGATVRIMLHYGQGGNSAGTQWFFDHIAAAGVPFDVIGLSYYPWWHGGLAALSDNLAATANRYGKDVMVVETAYPWRACSDCNANMNWPSTAAGQAQYLTDVAAAVKATPGGHGAAVFWWYPESMLTNGVFIWEGGAMAWFDDSGNALPVLTGR